MAELKDMCAEHRQCYDCWMFCLHQRPV